MSAELEILISLLKIINVYEDIEVNDYGILKSHPLVDGAKFLANECLIGDDGHPDRENIDIVVRAGFLIYPGEVDRFGWLTGCIELKKGLIIFG